MLILIFRLRTYLPLFNAYSIKDLRLDSCWSLCVPALTLAITDELLDFRALLFHKRIPCGKNFKKTYQNI